MADTTSTDNLPLTKYTTPLNLFINFNSLSLETFFVKCLGGHSIALCKENVFQSEVSEINI